MFGNTTVIPTGNSSMPLFELVEIVPNLTVPEKSADGF